MQIRNGIRDVNAKIIEQQLKSLAGSEKLSKLPVVWAHEGEYRETCQFALLLAEPDLLWKRMARPMADQIRKSRRKEAEWQTDAFVWNVICYLESPTDYREYLTGDRHTGSFAESDFVVLDDSSGFDWRGLRDLALIALLVSIILLLMLRS